MSSCPRKSIMENLENQNLYPTILTQIQKKNYLTRFQKKKLITPRPKVISSSAQCYWWRNGQNNITISDFHVCLMLMQLWGETFTFCLKKEVIFETAKFYQRTNFYMEYSKFLLKSYESKTFFLLQLDEKH